MEASFQNNGQARAVPWRGISRQFTGNLSREHAAQCLRKTAVACSGSGSKTSSSMAEPADERRLSTPMCSRRILRQASTATIITRLHLLVVVTVLAARSIPVGASGGSGSGGAYSRDSYRRSDYTGGKASRGKSRGDWQHPSSRPPPRVPWDTDRGTHEDKFDYAGRGLGGREGGRGRGRRGGGGEGEGGWSERRRSDSMREITELAKADAKAVRAAAEDAAAAAAAAAEAEAMWAAAGVGSGGGGGDNAMLFLECEVNGRQLRAFVDTGAQVTVMSEACAERCGLTSRIDTRFAGRAVGVGFARILGRIHDASIRIGNSYLTCSFTVIEHGEIDLLVGLDVLRAHRCDISLSKNRMRFHAGGGAREVAFLTRVERDDRRRRDRGRRTDPSAPPARSRAPPPLAYPPDAALRPFDDYTPPPRIARERARGTRGDGIPTPKYPGRRNVGRNSGAREIAGELSSRRMRGWPPRGGEDEEAPPIYGEAGVRGRGSG